MHTNTVASLPTVLYFHEAGTRFTLLAMQVVAE